MAPRLAPRLFTTGLAAAVALTGFATAPAHADSRDVARALAGVAAVAIIAKAIDNNKKKDRDRLTSRNYNNYNYNDGYYGQARPLPARVARKALPQSCVMRAEDRRGRDVRVLDRRCLDSNFRYASSLPRSCAVDIRTNRGKRAAYDANCLSRQGYTIARR